MDPQSRIELLVLGTAELRASDGSTFGALLSQPKRLALLTFLALATPRGFKRRQILLALFWPESNEERGRAALRQTVHAIRQQLGDDVIINRGEDEVSLNESRLWCDAAAAHEALAQGQLSRAIELYRGELLPGLFVEGASGFQEWLDAERRQLRQRVAEAALGAAEAAQPGSSVAMLMSRRALELAPGDETVARRVMQLYAADDPGSALRVYEQFAATLHREYEVAPSEGTRSLAAALRRQQRSAASAPPKTTALVKDGADRLPSASDAAVAITRERTLVVRRIWPAAAAAAAAIAVAGGFLWSTASASRATVNDSVVAVLPFRVTATDSTNNYLREGVVYIMNAQLTGDGVPNSVDARLVLNAWHNAVTSANRELTIDEAVSLARGLGAGRLIIGEFVGSPTSVNLSARMLETASGRIVSQYSSEPTTGDPLRLTSRMLSVLLAASLGESHDRLSRFSDSLSAVKAYLAGMEAYRHGQMAAARIHFRNALEIDTAFVSAAFWWTLATPNFFGPDKYLADSALWLRRDRLSRRDRTIVATLWSFGPKYPNPSTVTDYLRAYEQAALANPDRPEPWLVWGSALAAYGPQVGIADYRTRAASVLDHALNLDSTLVPVLDERLRLAIRMNDTARVRRLAIRYSGMAGVDSATAMLNQWLVALFLGDSAGRARLRQRMSQSALFPVYRALGDAAWEGAPLAELEISALQRPMETMSFDIAAMRGRVQDALAMAESAPFRGELVIRSITTFVTLAIVEPGFDDEARRALRDPLAFPDSTATNEFRSTAQYRAFYKCFTELWRAHEGDTRNTRNASIEVRRLIRAFDGRAMSAWIGPFDICPLLLDFAVDRGQSEEKAASTIERLDSLMRLGTGRDLSGVLANLVIADWKEKRGDYEGARAALRRRIAAEHRLYYLTAPAYLRAEGRVSAKLGDTAAAIAAYSAFLTLRDQPDAGPMKDQVSGVRKHLAQLNAQVRYRH
jgi:DNA-binding SARP family transcriptional activator